MALHRPGGEEIVTVVLAREPEIIRLGAVLAPDQQGSGQRSPDRGLDLRVATRLAIATEAEQAELVRLGEADDRVENETAREPNLGGGDIRLGTVRLPGTAQDIACFAILYWTPIAICGSAVC